MLRRLGVQSDDIFIIINTVQTLTQHQILVEARQKKPRKATFSVNIGMVDDVPAFQAAWREFAAKANDTGHLPENKAFYMAVLERSMPWNESVSFLSVMMAKGFDVKQRDGKTLRGDWQQ